MQEKIVYSEIMLLGFTETRQVDAAYYKQYGFDYCIVEKKLTENIYLDWAKETQLCKMVRIDNPVDCNIIKKILIRDLKHLKEIVEFFSDETTPVDFLQYTTVTYKTNM